MLLIDPPSWPAHGRLWSHLVSDTSIEELHDFAARIGIPRQGFEGDHYDVPEERYAAVVAAGARPTGGRELLVRLRDSGLRVSKRTHERVVQSTRDAPWLPPGGRADVITSRQDDPPPNTVVVRLAVTGPHGILVVPRPDGDPDLPSRALGALSADAALRALAEATVGAAPLTSRMPLLGYVRNVVRAPDADYPWPTPFACFTVHALSLAGGSAAEGEWMALHDSAARLAHRHWWPIVAQHVGLSPAVPAHD